MKGYIYKITSPSGKIYIGQTINLYMRKVKYKRIECKTQPKLFNSLKKYGWEAHIFEVIQEFTDLTDRKLLDKQEINWITFYDSYNKGLNCTIGGNSRENYIVSPETREKLSKASMGRKHSEESKEKIRQANIGKQHSTTTKEKIKSKRKNQIISEETKKKLSDKQKQHSSRVNYDNLALGVKFCSKCKETKLLECFDKSKRSKDGRTNPCKSCKAIERQDPEYKKKHAEYSKQRYNQILYSAAPLEIQEASLPYLTLPIITPS